MILPDDRKKWDRMKKNNKAFTLVELLAVVVILGVITTIAVPQYNQYIEKSKRSAFVTEANGFVDSVNAGILASKYKAPVAKNDVTVVNIDMIDMENKSDQSPYGADWVINKSYVAVINEGTELDPQYAYFFAAQDEDRNAIPLTRISDIREDSNTNEARNTMEVTVQSLAGNISGVTSQKGMISGLENAINGDGDVLDWNVTTYTNQQ